MELFGPVRWRHLGAFAALLGGPTLLLVHPRPTSLVLAVFGAVAAARALWLRIEPIPPALAAPDRPLGLPDPAARPAELRPRPEAVGLAGALRALRRSLGLPQTYARTALALLTLAGGTFAAGLAVDAESGWGLSGAVYYSAWILFVAAVSVGTAGLVLMVRESRREARESRLDG
ncbi:hypothetical protein EPO15_15755 [bacterium]|nr:MAG: hypothetical protein EPO15_15755 [bacterium]